MSLLMELRQGLADVADRALDVALPPTCAGCGVEGSAICDDCLPALDVRLEARPGVPIGMPADIPFPLVQLEWCASFTGVPRRAVHRLKYGGERRLARPLGEAMARRWAHARAGGDLLVPVPASPDRVRERGYDQAFLLARVVGHELDLPVAELLERTHATAAQFDLDRAERATNVRDAFRLREAAHPEPSDASDVDLLAGRWAVLVDDVVTTGSTLAACATVLLDAGAQAVSALTLARER